MRQCVLRAYRDGYEAISETIVSVPEGAGLPFLDGLARNELLEPEMACACIEMGHEVIALFIPEKLLPRNVVRLGHRRASGRWFTGMVELGPEGGHRALVGPEVFLRQFDVGGPDAWLALVFLRFGSSIGVRELCSSPQRVGLWTMNDERYLYVRAGWRWRLWGAGNTPTETIEAIVEAGVDSEQLTWQLGAIPLMQC